MAAKSYKQLSMNLSAENEALKAEIERLNNMIQVGERASAQPVSAIAHTVPAKAAKGKPLYAVCGQKGRVLVARLSLDVAKLKAKELAASTGKTVKLVRMQS